VTVATSARYAVVHPDRMPRGTAAAVLGLCRHEVGHAVQYALEGVYEVTKDTHHCMSWLASVGLWHDLGPDWADRAAVALRAERTALRDAGKPAGSGQLFKLLRGYEFPDDGAVITGIVAGLTSRSCARCAGPIPAATRGGALFCSVGCRVAHNNGRRRPAGAPAAPAAPATPAA